MTGRLIVHEEVGGDESMLSYRTGKAQIEAMEAEYEKFKTGDQTFAGGLLALAIPMIIIGVVSVYESSRSITEMARQNMIGITESLADAIGVGMSERLPIVKNVSFSNSVIAAAEKVAREGEKNSRNEIATCRKGSS